ncbi:MAG TPA: T9SS type A sorting domain-containing protein [Rubricoccaceae bacterium]|jgi:hypothetical protein
MPRFATVFLLALLAAGPASAQLASRTHTTGTAALRVFNNGYYGADAGVPIDTTFNFGGGSPLYEGQLLVGLSSTQISGDPYSNAVPTDGTPQLGFEWSFGPRPAVITPPAPFTQAYQTTYTDAGAANTTPAGLTVVQRTYSRTGDPFVIVEVDVSSATARSGVYIGMFADYDISATALTDRGGFDTATRTVYAFNAATGGNRNYYGITLLGAQQSGWSATAINDALTTPSDAQLFTALSTNGTAATANADRRLVVGAGPFTLAAGVAQRVRFAYVGGATLVALTANAAAAQALFPTAGEADPSVADGLSLGAATPNPASTQTALAFELDAAQTVRLAVVDVLGREVAVVTDGMRAAGVHTATVDTQALPAGVYVARLTAGAQTVTRRFTVAH